MFVCIRQDPAEEQKCGDHLGVMVTKGTEVWILLSFERP